MTSLFPPWPLLSAFLLASLVLALTPGPGVFYIVSRTLAQGRKVGLASVAGIALGNLGNALAAAVGLAALLAVSALAFTAVKYAGAAYLVWLGLRALRNTPTVTTAPVSPPAGVARVFREGMWVALLNPKTTLFFAAFLPQFVSSTAAPLLQSLVLGVLFVGIALVTDSAYALAAGTVAPAMAQKGRTQVWGRYLLAGAFISLGVFTALSGSLVGK